MKLDDFVKKYDNLRYATEEDNDKILNYYNTIGMESNISNVIIQRDPDFFKQLKYAAPIYHSFIAEDEMGQADGGLTAIVRPCYIDGKMEYATYMCDLRFKKERNTNFSWRDFTSELCVKAENIEEFKNSKFFISSVIDTNLSAKKSFVYKSARDNLVKERAKPIYLAWYNMVSIIARKPMKLFKKKSKIFSNLNINVSIATEKDKTELVKFLDEQNREKKFGYVFNETYNELERRLIQWDNFSMSSFFIARDELNNILGCFAPWDSSEGKKIILNKFPKILYLMAKILRLFGKKIPKKGSPLKILFLTHLEMKHDLSKQEQYDVFNKLLDSLYESKIFKNYHFIAFTDFFVSNLSKGIKKHYIIQKAPHALFQICTAETKQILNTEDFDLAPGVEIALA